MPARTQQPTLPPRPKWMTHRQYWGLRKHNPAKLLALVERYDNEPREHDPLDDYRAAMDRDQT